MIGLRRSFWMSVILSALAAAPNLAAEIYRLSIPAQPLAKALQSFAEQSGLSLVHYTKVTEAKIAPALSGTYTADDALAKLLENSGLRYIYIDPKTVEIRAAQEDDTGDLTAAPRDTQQRSLMLAQAEPENAPASAPATSGSGEPSADKSSAGEELQLEEVVVTGSRIGNTADRFSAVQRYDRDYLDRAGFASAADLIAVLPQNFGGGISADTISAGSSAGPGAATINLRGLDAGGTLTLLNGRRLAPSGMAGGFVDISAIPTTAIERIEVLTDGASAIYGSDAIAGVVNFILRKDFNGAETRLRLGSVTRGDGDEISFGQSFGRSDERGHALLSYEYGRIDGVLAKDKSFVGGALPTTQILPDTERNSVFATASRHFTDRVTLAADLQFLDRSTEQASNNFILQPTFDDSTVRQWGFSPSIGFTLSNRWSASLTGSLARTDYSNAIRNLEVFGGFDDRSRTEIDSIETLLEGHLFALPAGDVKSVLGYSFRRESHKATSVFIDGSVEPVVTDKHRRVNAVFGEFFVPLVAEGNRRRFVEQLGVSLAARYEHYSDVGSSTNPKLGLYWGPLPSLNLRASYGTSFRAPRLEQLRDTIFYTFLQDYDDPLSPGGEAPALEVGGQSSDIDPEESESLTLGFDFEPPSLPSFKLRASYYDIAYRDRLDTPLAGVGPPPSFNLQNFPLPLIRNPSFETLQNYVDRSPFFENITQLVPGGSMSELDDVTLLILEFPVNTVSTKTNGIDLSASYGLHDRFGDWLFDLNANYITRFDQQFSSLTPVESLYDKLFRPVDLRGRTGVSFTRGGLTASTFINYVDGYAGDSTIGALSSIASWTTFDASLQYRFAESAGKGILNGLALTFNVLNAFDEDPPRISNDLVLGPAGASRFYDPANADPQGRRIALQAVKRW